MRLAHSRLATGLLSLAAPGLGQWVRGDRAKGFALLCITGLLWVVLARTPSVPKRALYGFVYLCVLIPSVQDAARPPGDARPTGLDRPWYVIWMLLTIGPFALPLLWQSPAFSRRAKILWTLAVIIAALLCIAVVEFLGPIMEQALSGVELL